MLLIKKFCFSTFFVSDEFEGYQRLSMGRVFEYSAVFQRVVPVSVSAYVELNLWRHFSKIENYCAL